MVKSGHVLMYGRLRGVSEWEDNIKTDLKEVRWGVTDWIELAQDRDRWRAPVNTVMNLQVPLNAGNVLTISEPVSFSRRALFSGVSKWQKIEKDLGWARREGLTS